MMRVLVTGAAGCLGRAVCRVLQDAGYEVRGLGRSAAPAGEPWARIEWHTADLVTSNLHPAVAGCQAVVHCAALVHRPDVRDPAIYRQHNVQATFRLLEAAKQEQVKSARFVFISTTAVYGPDHDFHADETTACRPRTPYGQSKLDAERLVLDRRGVVLRLPLIYGPGDRGNMTRLIRGVTSGRFVLPGSCDKPHSMLASLNAAEAVRCALVRDEEASGEVFLITDDVDLTVRELVDLIRRASTAAPAVHTVPLPVLWPLAAAGSIAASLRLPAPVTLAALRKLTSRLTFSCEKAKERLGYRPVVTPAEAVAIAVLGLPRAEKRGDVSASSGEPVER